MSCTDFGVRSVPPCADCDDGRCTMNCGPAIKKNLLEEAYSHLVGAEAQSLPSDDQIIMDHVRSAIALLKVLRKGSQS